MSKTRARAGQVQAEAIAERWHSLAIHLLRRLRREDVKAGLTGPRLSALSVVVFAGPVTLGELAAAEQVKPPTMTRIVRALEREHLVRRERDAKDGRIVRLRATTKGQALLHAGRARRVAKLATPIAELDASDRDVLQRAAEILSGAVARLP
ncbi:MAG TPA: MarR family transcriptional regulator [Gemmatimonadaceae bacterium]